MKRGAPRCTRSRCSPASASRNRCILTQRQHAQMALLQVSLQVQWGDPDPTRTLELRSLRFVRPNPLDPFAGASP